jgi:hypothetical protein
MTDSEFPRVLKCPILPSTRFFLIEIVQILFDSLDQNAFLHPENTPQTY